VTDLPETKIYLSSDDGNLVTTVYGLMVTDTHLPAYSTFGADRKPDKLPALIKDLHTYLTVPRQSARDSVKRFVNGHS